MVFFHKGISSGSRDRKHVRIILFSVCLLLLVALFFRLTARSTYMSCEEMGEMFSKNQAAFENAVEVLSNARFNSFLQIQKDDYHNDRLYVVQIGELWYATITPTSQEVLNDLHDAVSPLFAAGIDSIYCDAERTQIEFSLSFEYGVASHLYYTSSGEKPKIGGFTIKEIKRITDNWYGAIYVS